MDIVIGGAYYRVPEDIFEFAARNLVDNGRAKWIPRRKLTLSSKAKRIAVNLALAVSPNRAETASLNRATQTAALPRARGRMVDTDMTASDFDFIEIGQ